MNCAARWLIWDGGLSPASQSRDASALH